MVRNWKRRWFTLKEGHLSYFEAPERKEGSGFTRGSGKPLWSASLKTALTEATGTLRCAQQYRAGGNRRLVTNLEFRDRTLTIGTAPGEQNEQAPLPLWNPI